MALSNEDKENLKRLAYNILCRVEIASDGCHNSQDWNDEEDNLSAPDGMSYIDWIEEAETMLILAIENA